MKEMKKAVSGRLVDQHHNQSRLAYEDDQEQLFNQQSLKDTKMYSYDYGEQDKLLIKISIIVFILVFTFTYVINKQWFDFQFSISNKSTKQYLIQALKNLDEDLPKKYLDIENIGDYYAQLPFCIVLGYSNIQNIKQIKESIQRIKYQNYRVLQYQIPDKKQQSLKNANTNKDNIEKGKQQKQKNKKEEKYQQDSYLEILSLIQDKCPQKSILMFPNKPLTIDSLQKQNNLYQTYNTWLLYSTQINSKIPSSNFREKIMFQQQLKSIDIMSVYKRVFQLIHKNDFDKLNNKVLKNSWHQGIIISGLLQLCKFYSFPVQSRQLYIYNSHINQNYSLFYKFSQEKQKQTHRRIPYQSLHTLDQDYKITDIEQINKNRILFQQSNYTITQTIAKIFPRENVVTHQDMERTLQFQQLIYLPDNHSLNLLEIKRMQKIYETDKYSQTELPLCITVNSYNNIHNQRYKKVLQSIVSQNYSNYNIVFIDDFSSDQTLKKSKQYLQEVLKFPRQKITYIRNSERKKMTYNIINSAFNFCSKDSIQIIIDGNDQLIGKQVFKAINAQYQAHDLWVLYTFYKNDKYVEGISVPFKNQEYKNSGGNRKYGYFFGQLKSFRTSLIRQIPLSQHQNILGNLFEDNQATALQYPIFQLAGGDKHGKFINQIMYLSHCHENTDSNIFQTIKQNLWHFFASFKSPLKQLTILGESEDKDVRQMLNKGKDKQYSIIS